MSTSNLCQHWDVPYLLKRGTAWNDPKPVETTWCYLKPPSNQSKPPKTTQEIPDVTWYQPQYIFFTKNESFFSCVALLLCNFGANIDRKLIILQITWNLSQELDVIMPHMNNVLIHCLFLRIVIILSFGQIWLHNLEFSK